MPQYCHERDGGQEARDKAACERLNNPDPYRHAEADLSPLVPFEWEAAYMDREQIADMLPFLTALARGEQVWHWEQGRRYKEHFWKAVEEINVLGNPALLSLVWRDDAPKLETET